MPWTTPSLREVRRLTRDSVTSYLPGAAMIASSVLRVLSDTMAALAHLVLRYIDWLSLQLLPDTAESEWLDRHGQIWLSNADGTRGRKAASFSAGTITVTGTNGTILPLGTRFANQDGTVEYETIEEVTIALDPTPVMIRALDGGAAGNLDTDEQVPLTAAIAGIDGSATVVELSGGADEETDAELRERILERIQQPPMGGDAEDYVRWALMVPGVTRAWCAPNEMGIGTVTLRFMMDDLRLSDQGLPNDDDILAVSAFIDTVRPVTVKDFFCVAPIPQPINVTISDLEKDDVATRAAIEAALLTMIKAKAKPGQEIYHSWVSEAISIATGEVHHDLTFANAIMPSPGHLAVLGTIAYV